MKRKSGFTLVELLVVIAIIGILVGLLLPAVQAVRQAARRTQCINNIKQWGLAIQNYEGVFKSMPGSRFNAPPNTQFYTSDTGWMLSLLPYIEQQALYDNLDTRTYTFASNWAGNPVGNQGVVSFNLEVNSCPSADEASELFNLSEFYGGGAGQNLTALTGDYAGARGYWEGSSQPALSDLKKRGAVPLFINGVNPQKSKMSAIRDGLSNTFIMWESAGAQWYFHQNNQLQTGTWDDFMANYTPDLVVRENDPNTYFPSSPDSKAYFASWAGVNTFPVRTWDDDGLVFGNGPNFSRVMNVTNAFRSPFSFHPNIVIVGFADGSTKTMEQTMDWRVFVSLATGFGGEPVETPQ